MRLNNKGFTMVELLAAISILAILSGVAVIAVTKFQEKAREETYKTMETSAFNAAQNYIQDNNVIVSDIEPKRIYIYELFNKGYLPELQDPRVKGANCHEGSIVYVTKEKGSGSTLDSYTYNVVIKCSNYTSHHYEGATKVEGVIFNS